MIAMLWELQKADILQTCLTFCRPSTPSFPFIAAKIFVVLQFLKNISSNLASQIFPEHPGFVFFLLKMGHMIFGIRITTPWRYLFEQWRCRIGLRNVTFWRMVYNHQNQTTTTIVAWPKNTFTYNSKCGTCLCTKRRSCPCYSARGKLDVVPSYRLLEGASYQTVCLNLATPHLCVSRIVSQAFFWNNKHFPSFRLVWLYKILAWMTGWYCDDSWNILFYGFLLPCQLCTAFSFHNFC